MDRSKASNTFLANVSLSRKISSQKMLVKINIVWKIESHLKIVKVVHKHDLSPRQQQQQPGGENGVTMLNSLAYFTHSDSTVS